MLTFLQLEGDPRTRGRQHGETLRDAIQELVQIRRTLLLHKSTFSPDAVNPLARQQWDITQAAFPSIAAEMEGIAEGAGVSIEDLVVLNNYTDFRDIRDGCTAVYAAQGDEAFLGQTWDMHGSAEKYVVGLQIGDLLVLSVAGCVGMMGINRFGAAVVVNNLTSNDAKVGVVWPALVRAMLERSDLGGMVEVLQGAKLSSGHNYMLADPHACQNWETSGTLKKMTWASKGNGLFFHTNHYLDPSMRDCEGKLAAVSTTHDRYIHMEKANLHDQPLTPRLMIQWLSSHEGAPRSICSHLGTDDPDASKTCGGVVADVKRGSLHAWRGCLLEDGNSVVVRARVHV